MTAVLTIIGFAVAAGIGGSLRWVSLEYGNGEAPLGTFAVNVFASLVLGLLVGFEVGGELFLQVALLGTLSTWSTLANEVAKLLRTGNDGLAAVYLSTTIVAGVCAAWGGLLLGR